MSYEQAKKREILKSLIMSDGLQVVGLSLGIGIILGLSI